MFGENPAKMEKKSVSLCALLDMQIIMSTLGDVPKGAKIVIDERDKDGMVGKSLQGAKARREARRPGDAPPPPRPLRRARLDGQGGRGP
jgi:hypothetical protein